MTPNRPFVALCWLALCTGCGSHASDANDPSDPNDPNDPSDPNDPNDPNDPSDPSDPSDPADGVAVLGGGAHDPAQVTVTEVLGPDDGLDDPSALAFHPVRTAELWITNRGDDSIVIAAQALGGEPIPSRRWDPTSNHFLAQPAGLAFNDDGESFATIHDEDNFTQGPPPQGTPADFMGPTLWTADSDIFEGGDISHLDMLHNSPNGVGIAWERDNVYWVVDGGHGSITRYDFAEPHELGGTDHSDGVIERWVEGEFTYVEGSVSHAAFDHETGLLYYADTGGNRVMALDTTTGEKGSLYGPAYDSPFQYHWNDADVTVVIDGAAAGLEAPAGLVLHDGLLFLTDTATATVWAFDLAGAPVDWLPLGREPGGLQGLAFDRDGGLWLTDAQADAVLQITP